MLVEKILVKQFFGQKNLVKKKSVQKKFLLKNVKKICGQKKIWSKKLIFGQKILRQKKKVWSKNIFSQNTKV